MQKENVNKKQNFYKIIKNIPDSYSDITWCIPGIACPIRKQRI